MDTDSNFSQGDMNVFDNASQENTPEEERDMQAPEGTSELEDNDLPLERKNTKSPKEHSPAFKSFLAQWGAIESIEEKIRGLLVFMRSSLSQAPAPRMRDYWEARKLCLPLFKEAMSAAKRAELWAEYIELSSEARRLKEIANEQASFAAEQIGLAIDALEKDLENYASLLETMPSIDFPAPIQTIEKKRGEYNILQRELHLLNTFASRINSLRKEIIKTEMRARQKSKFFERLSSAGDKVFPRRKELIKEISHHFSEDIANFYKEHFEKEGEKVPPLFVLREEIKALQSLAKILTLNTRAFTETRLLLSQCWDKLKAWDRERKKEISQKKQAFKENVEKVQGMIQELSKALKAEEFSEQKFHQMTEDILNFMKSVELGREEVRSLKEQLHEVREPFVEKIKERERETENKAKEQERARKSKMDALREDLQKTVEDSEKYSVEEIAKMRDRIQQELEQLQLSKSEKAIIERFLKRLRDLLHEKKEQAMMRLSPDDKEAFEQLKLLLEERKERRQEIKQQLEEYRVALGGSGFDFAKALSIRELIEEEKERLEKANEAIDEIEEKIADLEERYEE